MEREKEKELLKKQLLVPGEQNVSKGVRFEMNNLRVSVKLYKTTKTSNRSPQSPNKSESRLGKPF